jgi:transposase
MGERHCRDARFVWNLAVEQFNWGGSGRSAPGSAERMRQLAEARPEFEWLGCGARQRKCSTRWQATKAEIGRVHQRVADRRRDWVEKVTTRLAANYELVAVEALPVRAMVRRPKPKPDPDNSGQFLPNGAAAKAGLNRSIHANCWGLIAKRLEQKMSPSGTTLVVVPAQYSSQQCRKCGHISPENRKSQAEFRCQLCGHADHADANAAAVILARAMPAPTPGPGATPSGVLAKART